MTTIFILLIFSSYISMGLPDSSWGTAWPFMRAELLLPLASAGIFSAVITVCSALSSAFAPKLCKKIGIGPIMAMCALVTGACILGISFASNFYTIVLIGIPLGISGGGVDVCINNYVSERFSPRIMNWVHASWGIGSMLGPIILTAAITTLGSWRKGFLILALVQFVLAVIQFCALPLWKKSPVPILDVKEDEITTANDVAKKRIAIFLSVLVFFVYCGVEVTVGSWLNSLLIEQRNFGATLGGSCVSVYYGGIMTGRVLLGFFSNKLGNKRTMYFGLVLASIGAGLFFITSSVAATFIAVALLGIGFGPIYPCNMHQTTVRFTRETSRKVIGYQVASACLGMLFISPAIGYIMQHTSYESLSICVAVLTALLVLVIILLNLATRSRKTEHHLLSKENIV